MANQEELENKLDEDFLFYLGFTTGLVNKFANQEDFGKCQAWLQKLVGQRYTTVEEKRNRNVYLSQLVLCVEDGKLSGPFLKNPNDVDISDALKVFGPSPCEIVEPEWLKDIETTPKSLTYKGDPDGRTYLATRTLPGGQGAFAYLAVTLAEEEPKWLGGGEGAFERMMEKKFKEKVPPRSELQKALARRKDPDEIKRVVTFYEGVLQNIADELDGIISACDNNAVNSMLMQLVDDLKAKNEFCALEELSEKDRRVELLLKLHDLVAARKKKVIQREDALDDLERSLLPQSFFEYSVTDEDRISFPEAMWKAAIQKEPTRRHMQQLQQAYPAKLIDKFVEFLTTEKEEIALRMQRRHENIVSQMKRELRKEAEKGQKLVDEAKEASNQFCAILKDVREQSDKRNKVLEEKEKRRRGGITAKTALYEKMRQQLMDQQQFVEDEAEVGRKLANEINMINAQTEEIQQINEQSIMKVEEANMNTMKNIKKLRTAIRSYECRLKEIQETTKNILEGKKAKMLLY